MDEELNRPSDNEPADDPAAVQEELDPATQALLDARDRLVEERERLSQERDSLLDQLKRKQAEFENYRKRTEREQREFSDLAAMNVVRQVLPVMDALERALTTGNESAGEFRTGIEHIARQMWGTLTRLGVEPIPAQGGKFDPHLHEAIETVATEEHEDHTVLEEYQRGYRFKGKLLRPAMVNVAVRPNSQ